MKKLLLASLMSLFSAFSFSSHEFAGDITYVHVSGDDYLVTLTLFVDCNALPVVSSAPVNATSSCNSFTSALPIIGTVDIDPQCTVQTTMCNRGSAYGAKALIYSGLLTLPACNDWYISWSSCCRNSAAVNIQNPSTHDLHIGTYLDNSTGPNSSPIFMHQPLTYMCNQNDFCVNNTAFDIDGDSLVYNLVSPRGGQTTNIPFQPGYSATQPFGIGNSTFNSANGNVCINGASLGAYQTAVEVREYRNGNLIGITTREIQLLIYNCGLSAIDISGNVSNGTNSFSNVKVYLYEYDIDESGMTLLDSTLTNASGDYDFLGLSHHQFMTKAAIDTTTIPGYLPSYHMGSYYWNYGQIIYSTCDSMLNGDIELAPTTNPVGIGVISGYMNGLGVFRSNEEPMKGYWMYLIDNATDQLVAHAETNEFGFYQMNNIPNGTYRVMADVPGLIHTSYHFVTVSSSTPHEQVNYTATPDGIYAGDWTSTLETPPSLNKIFKIFPNPVNNQLIISSTVQVKNMIIHDVQGKVVKKIDAPTSQSIDVSNLPSGVYLIRLNGKHIERFVKE